MSGCLVGDEVRRLPAREHARENIRGIAEQADGNRTPLLRGLLEPGERILETVGACIEVAGA